MHVSDIFAFVDLIMEFFPQSQSFGGDRGQALELVGRDPRYEFRISERLVVARVSEELGGIVEEMLDIFVREAGCLRGLFPVAAEMGVQGDYEVIDCFGFWADLAENDPGAGKRGAVPMSGLM
jgi:hypothetical protein